MSSALKQVTNTLLQACVAWQGYVCVLYEAACASVGTGRWITVAGMNHSFTAGASKSVRFLVQAPPANDVTIRIADDQLLQFDTLQECMEYSLSGAYCPSTAFRKRQTWGIAAPTTGTWSQGDIVWNTAPTAGGSIGWVYTGTAWKTFGSIAS